MTVFFPDVSHYQAGLSLRGAQAVIAKASQGVSYTDPAYAGFKAQAAALGIPFAAYHWLDTADAAAQARHCYSVVGATPLMIDDEQGVINVPHTLAFVAAYRALGGRVVLEYAPRWVWQNSGSPNLRPLAAAGLGIVASNYPASGYTDTGPGWTPYGLLAPQDIVAWQYTDKQLFNGQHVDFNAYRGSVAALMALLAGGTGSSGGTDAMALNEGDVNNAASIVIWNIKGWLLENVQRTRNIENIVAAMATKIDIDPAELEAIKQASAAGAAAAFNASVPVLVDALVAKLPAGAMTRQDVEQAVRDAFAGGLAPAAG